MTPIWGKSQAAEPSRVEVDISAQNAEAAVKSLARAFKRSVLFQTKDIAAVKSNAVKGRYSLRRALDEMFAGTSLEGGLTERGVITVSLRETTETSGGKQPMKRSKFFLTTALTSMATAFSAAQAQDDAADGPTEQIIIVGTQIKGANIAGELPVTLLDEETIEATGDLTFEELLSSIPQAGGLDFN
ncbi:MAG: STN domain-containing protein, partial [Sphingomonadales bacterium]|nr:STN domain-containing protein [Sphingomonadales bacterium]